jgi:hypothetical protein
VEVMMETGAVAGAGAGAGVETIIKKTIRNERVEAIQK